MSFQVTVLKVLAGYPEGRLSVEDLQRAVTLLICSGPDFTDRMKSLLAMVPELDIFSQGLVVRDDKGWQITEAGRSLLANIEKLAAVSSVEENLTAEVYSTSAQLPALAVARRRGLRTRRRNRERLRRPQLAK